MRLKLKDIYASIAILLITFLVVIGLGSILNPPSVNAGIGGGFFAFRPVPGVTVASSALNAAVGTDTILSVTEGGQITAIIVEVDSADVTGTPSVDLLVTVDGTLSTIPLYVAGTTFPTWVQQLVASQAASSGSVGNAILQTPTQTQITGITGAGPVFLPAINVTESGILHGIQITVGVNVVAGVASEAFLRIIADGVTEDIPLYGVGLNTWDAWTTFQVQSILASTGTGATATDNINLALHVPYQNSLQVGIFNAADAFVAGRLDFNIVRSASSVSGGGSGAVSGNSFRWDINAQYLQSLLVEVDRTAVATSASTLNVSVLRNTRVPN